MLGAKLCMLLCKTRPTTNSHGRIQRIHIKNIRISKINSAELGSEKLAQLNNIAVTISNITDLKYRVSPLAVECLST